MKTKVKVATAKTLIFPIGELFLAVYLDAVERVVRLPEIFKSGQKLLGVAQVGDAEIIILDLHQKVYGIPSKSPVSHIIILKTTGKISAQTKFGIPVSTLPEISDVLQSEIRPLPETYRHEDTLGIASHIFTVSKKDKTMTAFLLPPESLLDLFQTAKTESLT